MSKSFVRLDPAILQKGMYPDSDLFYLNQDKPLLLCRGGSLIDNMAMNRLRYIASIGQQIYVSEETARNLEHQAQFFLKEDKEAAARYEETAKACSGFLHEVKESGQVNMQAVVKLVSMTGSILENADVSFLLQCTHFLDEMDNALQGHSTDVAVLNGMMGKWLGLPEEDIKRLVMVGFLHDIGKLKVPDKILNKPSKFTAEEFEVVKKHPIYSYEICKQSGIDDEEILMGVRQHHERLNGTGYPDKLVGDDIGAYARVTAISDIYDAMVSERVYKKASTPFEVLEDFYLEQFANLDISYVNLFMDHMVNELNGKYVILSDGSMGQITYIDKQNVRSPIISGANGVIQTSPDTVQVVAVCGAII